MIANMEFFTVNSIFFPYSLVLLLPNWIFLSILFKCFKCIWNLFYTQYQTLKSISSNNSLLFIVVLCHLFHTVIENKINRYENIFNFFIVSLARFKSFHVNLLLLQIVPMVNWIDYESFYFCVIWTHLESLFLLYLPLKMIADAAPMTPKNGP